MYLDKLLYCIPHLFCDRPDIHQYIFLFWCAFPLHRLHCILRSSIHPIQFLIWRIKESISCFVLKLNMYKYEIVLTSIIIIFLPKDLKIYVLTFSCCCLIYVPPFLPSTLQWPEARFLGLSFKAWSIDM